MKPHWPTVSVATWTALLALLAAWLLTWAPPAWAGDPAPADRATALLRAQAAVVGVQVLALEDARSSRTLGQARAWSSATTAWC